VQKGKVSEREKQVGGWAGWVLQRLRKRRIAPPRLALVERIALAPRQSLALVEAEGRRILVATSAEGGPTFYALDERVRPIANPIARLTARSSSSRFESSRVSW